MFLKQFLAAKALDWDRKEIDGRPMFVSPFEEKGNKTKKFKVGQRMMFASFILCL